MGKILLEIINISALIAIPASSLVLGLNIGKLQFREALDNKSLLVKYAVALFIVAPAITVIYFFFLSEYRPVWIALLIISLSPPMPSMIKKVSNLGINQNMSMLLVLSGILLSLILVPLTLIVLENLLNVSIDLGIDDVAIKISILFIIPVVVAFLFSSIAKNYVKVLIKIVDPVSKAAMLVLIVCLLIVAVPIIIGKGIIPVLLVLLFQVTVLVITHFISLSEKTFGPVIPFSVLLRLPAPAVVISNINNSLDKNIGTILVFTILGAVLITIYSKWLMKSRTQS